MKDDSLYVIAIVAVVAVVGLVIMATGNTVVAQESLPDMVDSDSSAISGQAIETITDSCRLAVLEENVHNELDRSNDLESYVESFRDCNCEQLLTLITSVTSYADQTTRDVALYYLYELYREECEETSLQHSLIITSGSEEGSTSEITSPSTGSSGTIRPGDMRQASWGNTVDSPIKESVLDGVPSLTETQTMDDGDCDNLAENMNATYTEQDARDLLDTAKKYCDCDEIDDELTEYAQNPYAQWLDVWGGWMLRNCLELRMVLWHAQ